MREIGELVFRLLSVSQYVKDTEINPGELRCRVKTRRRSTTHQLWLRIHEGVKAERVVVRRGCLWNLKRGLRQDGLGRVEIL
jgi:hypothetical protein